MEKQRKIGIDIDNTLFFCPSIIYNIAAKLKFSSSKNKLKFSEIPYRKDVKVNKIWKYAFSFFNPRKYKEFPAAIDTINKLHEEGNQIFLITSRPVLAPFVSSLQEWLNGHNVSYDKLIMGCSNKSAYVAQNNIALLIDDLQRNCKEVEEVGAKTIMFKGSLKTRGGEFKMSKSANIVNSWKMVLDKVQELFKEEAITFEPNFFSVDENTSL